MAVLVGSSSGKGRLVQEDVEELEQQRQDHGPQRKLIAAGSGSGWPLRLLGLPAALINVATSCGVTITKAPLYEVNPDRTVRLIKTQSHA